MRLQFYVLRGELALVHPFVEIHPDKRFGEARIHDYHVEIRHSRILGYQLLLVDLALHLHQKLVASQNIRRLVQNTVLDPEDCSDVATTTEDD